MLFHACLCLHHGDRSFLMYSVSNDCHDTSAVTAHVDHVIGFSIFTEFQVSSLDQDVVAFVSRSLHEICMSFVFQCVFLYIVLSAVNFCISRQCFTQSPLLFPSLSVCGPRHARSTPNPGPNLATPKICLLFLVELVCFSILLHIFQCDDQQTSSCGI